MVFAAASWTITTKTVIFVGSIAAWRQRCLGGAINSSDTYPKGIIPEKTDILDLAGKVMGLNA